MFEKQKVIATSRPEGSRKRKRGIEQPNHILSACDLLPLQQEVLFKQMEVFPDQLQLIVDQREYYRLNCRDFRNRSVLDSGGGGAQIGIGSLWLGTLTLNLYLCPTSGGARSI